MKITHPQVLKCLKKNLTSPILFSLFLLSTQNSHALTISDLLITEIMANPSAVTDSNGEWFEIYNPADQAFDFNGISLSDNGSNYHLINQTDPLLIQPGEYFVFGKNGNELENGGYTPDYIYSSFTLGNLDDEIILSDTIGNILSLEYNSGFAPAGHSMELTSPDMQLTSYITTTEFNYGAGDYGTPGSAGSYHFTTNSVSVPEPPLILLLLTGIIGLRCRQKLRG